MSNRYNISFHVCIMCIYIYVYYNTHESVRSMDIAGVWRVQLFMEFEWVYLLLKWLRSIVLIIILFWSSRFAMTVTSPLYLPGTLLFITMSPQNLFEQVGSWMKLQERNDSERLNNLSFCLMHMLIILDSAEACWFHRKITKPVRPSWQKRSIQASFDQ